MKNKIFAALTTLSLASLTLTGCSLGSVNISCGAPVDQAPDGVGHFVSAVIAPTATFVNFDNVIEAAGADVKSSLLKDGTQFDVILADGNPALETQNWVTFEDMDVEVDKQNTIDYVYQSLQDVTDCATIVNEGDNADQALKTQPESNILQALQIAADGFASDSPENKIFVLSNGLQTAGQFKMQDGMPSKGAGAASLVAALASQGALPNLHGATVNWYGLGQVDGVKQAQLNQQTIDGLQEFWTAVINQSGGQVGKIVRSVAQREPASSSVQATSVVGLKDACLYTLTESDGFVFKADSAQFTDVAKARIGAETIASAVKKSNCTGGLVITGYTASGVSKSEYPNTIAKAKALSLARANAFKGLLSGAGVALPMKVVGGGKGASDDWNPDGTFNEDLGKLNRKVVITQAAE